jgi:hypothetical protein
VEKDIFAVCESAIGSFGTSRYDLATVRRKEIHCILVETDMDALNRTTISMF